VWANVHGSYPIGIGLALIFAGAELGDRLLGRRDRTAARTRAFVLVVAAVGAALLGTRDLQAFGLPAAAVLLLFAVFVAVDGREPLFRDPPPADPSGVWRLLAVACAMTVAVLANPRGFEIYTFPFEFTARETAVTRYVTEWRPLLDAPGEVYRTLAVGAYLVFVAAWFAALALGVRRGSLGRLELGLFLALGLLPLRHLRWIGLFALATAPALASTLGALSGERPASGPRAALAMVLAAFGGASLAVAAVLSIRAGPDPALVATLVIALACAAVALAPGLAEHRLRVERAGLALAFAAACGLAGLAVVHGIPRLPHQRLRPALRAPGPRGWTAKVAPAVAFLRTQEIPGRLFTNYGWASFAIHELWPSVSVFVDGRSEVYGAARVEQYVEILQSSPRARQAIRRHGIDLVLLPPRTAEARRRKKGGILAVVEEDPRWGLLYADDATRLYGRLDLDRRLPQPLGEGGLRELRPNAGNRAPRSASRARASRQTTAPVGAPKAKAAGSPEAARPPTSKTVPPARVVPALDEPQQHYRGVGDTENDRD
jgi:dolichol kinase